jgi:hypothetical protein
MSNTNTGGPAFPGPYVNDKGGLEAIWKQGGMTLRDYFAAKAMQSMNGRQDYLDAPASAIALDAYALADEMLKARSAGKDVERTGEGC